MSKLVIIGAGGHGKVVADAAQKMKQYDDIVFLDARYATLNSLLGFAVIGDDAMIPELVATACEFVVAIGDNRIRARIFLTSSSHSMRQSQRLCIQVRKSGKVLAWGRGVWYLPTR